MFLKHHCWVTAAHWQLSHSDSEHSLIFVSVSVLVHHSHCTSHHYYCHFSNSESVHSSEISIQKNWLCLCMCMLLMCNHLLTDKTLARHWLKKKTHIFEDISNTYMTMMWSCTNKRYTNKYQQWETWCIQELKRVVEEKLQRESCCAVNKSVVNITAQQHWNANLIKLGKQRHSKIVTSWWSHHDAVMMLKNQCMKEKIVVKTRRSSCWNGNVWMTQPLSKSDKAIKYICEFLKSCTSSFLEISFIINETMSLFSHHNSLIV